MRTILLSTLAFGALTSTALADGPLVLTDKQMDGITAGYQYVILVRDPVRGWCQCAFGSENFATRQEAKASGESYAQTAYPGQKYRIQVNK
jgi:hypothetical protein